jgi:hypothetical protein
MIAFHRRAAPGAVRKGREAMASTNEDVVVLATARGDDGRLLVVRHLPDRGTVELGWWVPDANGTPVPAPSVLELAAEAVEIDAVVRLGAELAAAGRGGAGEGETVATTGPVADGAEIVAVRAGDGLKLVRRPEGGELDLPSQAALDRLAGTFPAARQKLAALGFGLVQQGSDAATALDQVQPSR